MRNFTRFVGALLSENGSTLQVFEVVPHANFLISYDGLNGFIKNEHLCTYIIFLEKAYCELFSVVDKLIILSQKQRV